MPERIHLVLDPAQRRITRKYQAAVVQGKYAELFGRPLSGWDARWGTRDGNNDHLTYVDPITGTLLLTPAPFLQAWAQSGSGIYARLSGADVTFGDSSKWDDHVMDGGNSTFLKLVDANASAGARTVLTNTTWAKNRGFYLGLFNWDWNAEDRGYRLECGWNNSASGASGVSVRIWSNGDVEVWKDNIHVGSGSIRQDKSNAVLKVCLIPFRQRDLLIVTSEGRGFVHTFSDIDEQDTDPTITSASKFWVNVPTGSIDIEMAPIRYPSSAYRASVELSWRRAPDAGETLFFTRPGETELPFAFFPGYGTQTVAAVHADVDNPANAFVPNGTVRASRFRADFTSDGESTAFLHALEGFYQGQAQMTPAGDDELILSTKACQLEVPEHPAGVKLTLSLFDPETIDPGNAKGLLTTSNRAFSARLGSIAFLDGRTEPVRWKQAPEGSVQDLTLEVRDRWKQLEEYRFNDPVPLDRLRLDLAFKTILEIAGWDLDTEVDIPEIPVDLPFGGPNAGGSGEGRTRWSTQIEVGDRAGEWLQRLHESYCANFDMRIRPLDSGIKFRLVSPDGLGREPLATIYDEAVTALSHEDVGDDRGRVHWLTYRGYEEWMMEPLLTTVYVTGLDRRTLQPLQALKRDAEREDPLLAAEARPAGWVGEPREFGWVDGTLTTQDAVNRACDLIFGRDHLPRFLCEWEGNFLIDSATGIPLWPGDVVRMKRRQRGETIDQLVRIVSFSTDFPLEPWEGLSQHVVRPAKYMGQVLKDEDDTGTGHQTVAQTIVEMREWAGLSMVSRTVGPDAGADWSKRIPVGGIVVR